MMMRMSVSHATRGLRGGVTPMSTKIITLCASLTDTVPLQQIKQLTLWVAGLTRQEMISLWAHCYLYSFISSSCLLQRHNFPLGIYTVPTTTTTTSVELECACVCVCVCVCERERVHGSDWGSCETPLALWVTLRQTSNAWPGSGCVKGEGSDKEVCLCWQDPSQAVYNCHPQSRTLQPFLQHCSLTRPLVFPVRVISDCFIERHCWLSRHHHRFRKDRRERSRDISLYILD